jgi:Saxitoxin biosynthesis operon protein SxtJ
MKSTLPSNRSFGWSFTGFFLLAGIYGLWKGAGALPWLLPLALMTALVTLTRDTWLTPLNRAWMKFGDLLGRVVSPIVLGAIFFGIFTPVGVVMRLCGRDAMCRKFDPAARSYWMHREPPGPPDGSYRNMF